MATGAALVHPSVNGPASSRNARCEQRNVADATSKVGRRSLDHVEVDIDNLWNRPADGRAFPSDLRTARRPNGALVVLAVGTWNSGTRGPGEELGDIARLAASEAHDTGVCRQLRGCRRNFVEVSDVTKWTPASCDPSESSNVAQRSSSSRRDTVGERCSPTNREGGKPSGTRIRWRDSSSRCRDSDAPSRTCLRDRLLPPIPVIGAIPVRMPFWKYQPAATDTDQLRGVGTALGYRR